ncbi:hypothetical protein FNF29_02640 [Cafeteria roenbergensis]|uniref:Uncharacterized protein n=1 Tax=Cafeteria roenbergensis TaxID=33653 RepID=A0A5A8CNC3_CAFRO|nr:hypothetical protein FNF29_02640 [Cafeteria roenbergensis]|eukprot:KAA0154017.1 hypothetical protein FNF29_02640 [Cafeteria roenbergensis]
MGGSLTGGYGGGGHGAAYGGGFGGGSLLSPLLALAGTSAANDRDHAGVSLPDLAGAGGGGGLWGSGSDSGSDAAVGELLGVDSGRWDDGRVPPAAAAGRDWGYGGGDDVYGLGHGAGAGPLGAESLLGLPPHAAARGRGGAAVGRSALPASAAAPGAWGMAGAIRADEADDLDARRSFEFAHSADADGARAPVTPGALSPAGRSWVGGAVASSQLALSASALAAARDRTGSRSRALDRKRLALAAAMTGRGGAAEAALLGGGSGCARLFACSSRSGLVLLALAVLLAAGLAAAGMALIAVYRPCDLPADPLPVELGLLAAYGALALPVPLLLVLSAALGSLRCLSGARSAAFWLVLLALAATVAGLGFDPSLAHGRAGAGRCHPGGGGGVMDDDDAAAAWGNADAVTRGLHALGIGVRDAIVCTCVLHSVAGLAVVLATLLNPPSRLEAAVLARAWVTIASGSAPGYS